MFCHQCTVYSSMYSVYCHLMLNMCFQNCVVLFQCLSLPFWQLWWSSCHHLGLWLTRTQCLHCMASSMLHEHGDGIPGSHHWHRLWISGCTKLHLTFPLCLHRMQFHNSTWHLQWIVNFPASFIGRSHKLHCWGPQLKMARVHRRGSRVGRPFHSPYFTYYSLAACSLLQIIWAESRLSYHP